MPCVSIVSTAPDLKARTLAKAPCRLVHTQMSATVLPNHLALAPLSPCSLQPPLAAKLSAQTTTSARLKLNAILCHSLFPASNPPLRVASKRIACRIVRHARETSAQQSFDEQPAVPASYTHLRAHETGRNLVCRPLLEKKNTFFAYAFTLSP